MKLGPTFKVTILFSVLLLVAGCVATGDDISAANKKITEKFANMQTLYYDVSVTQSTTQNTVEGTQTTTYSNVFYLKKPNKSKLIINSPNSSTGGSICNGTTQYILYPTTQTFKVIDHSSKPCVNLNPEENSWLIPLEWGDTEKYSTVITEETLGGKPVWRAQVNQLNPVISYGNENGGNGPQSPSAEVTGEVTGSSQKSYVLWFDKDTLTLLKMSQKSVQISYKNGVSYETIYVDDMIYSKFIIDDVIDDSIFYPPTEYTQSNGNGWNPNDSNELNPNDSNELYPNDSNELYPNDSNELNDSNSYP